MSKDSAARPFYTVLVLAFVCALLVSGAAVGLRDRQDHNKELDRNKNILKAAGIYQKNVPVAEAFNAIEPRIIELATGKFVEPGSGDLQADYDQRQAVKSPSLSRKLNRQENIAGLGRLEKYSYVYLVHDHGKLAQVVLPVRGKGLWSTMYGYISLAPDLSTIRGISFYEHGETPGLGGEIENQRWLNGWTGKRIFNDAKEIVLRVIKGEVGADTAEADFKVDGISGATLTGNGVNNLLKFWFAEHGFKPFLDRFGRENLNH